MAEEHKGGSDDERSENEDDLNERRLKRQKMKSLYEDATENPHDLANLRSDRFTKHLEAVEEDDGGVVRTRELQYGVSHLKVIAQALLDSAAKFCDLSGRFSYDDAANSIKHHFNNKTGPGLNWELFGERSRVLFRSVPTFSTMNGPIAKEERARRVAVRRNRDNNEGVVAQTGQVIENKEEDGTDEATSARVTKLLAHLESFQGQEFDLLRELIDPSNPVQSVENLFDFSYLHKVSLLACLLAL